MPPSIFVPTLWSMRKQVTDQELDTVLFHQVTEKPARAFQVDPGKQRLDSAHTYEKSPTCVVRAAWGFWPDVCAGF